MHARWRESTNVGSVMNKKITIAAVALAVCAAVGGGLYQRHRLQQREAGELTLQGNVDMRQVSLGFNATGRIARLLGREGEHVRKGQLLGELDTSTLSLQVAQARAQLGARDEQLRRLRTGARPQEIRQADANVRGAEAQLRLARIQLARLEGASGVSAGEAVSATELDNARANRDVAQSRLDALREASALLHAGARREDVAEATAQRNAGQAQLALLQRNLADAQLVAPLDGTLRSRLQEPGDLTNPQKPVYALALTDGKWVRVYVPESALGRIRPGMAARIRIDSAPGHPLDGTVGYISSVAEFTPKTVQTEELRSSLVYEVRVQAQDPQDRLRLGMPATVTIPLGAAPSSGSAAGTGTGHAS